MAMNWYPHLAGIHDHGVGGRKRRAIRGVVIHHTATVGDSLAYVSRPNNRDSHPTYYVDHRGAAFGVVSPWRRPFSTANPIDVEAVTFEVRNTAGSPDWPVADAALERVIDVSLHHMREGGFKRAALNQPYTWQDEFWVGWHQQYVSTGCPGPWLLARMQYIVNELNRRINGGAAPAAPAVPAPVQGELTKLVDAVLRGDYGNGAERVQRLGARYDEVQAAVNRRLEGLPAERADAAAPKTVRALAAEVIAGQWGNGEERVQRLGNRYAEVQEEVNRMLGIGSAVNIDELARAVIRGDYGNGEERVQRLGGLYDRVQARVNELL